MNLTIGSPASKEQKEEKKRQWKDPDESLKYVCERGKVKCLFCSDPIGGLNVTSNTHLLQDSKWLTTGDRNGKINFDFEKTCTHPSQKSPPCKSVISLGKWKNYSDVHIDNHHAITVKSTIPCMVSGTDITVERSGQMASLMRINPILWILLTIASESKQIHTMYVCQKLDYFAEYSENGEAKESGDVCWTVKIGEAEEVNLEKVKEIIQENCQLTGMHIYFPIPQEWRYKKIILTAYLKCDKNVKISGTEFFVKDHIVAAFYRVKNKNPHPFIIHNIKGIPKGSENSLFSIHHFQGMYRENNQFYFTGSSKTGTEPYLLIIEKCDEEGCSDGDSNLITWTYVIEANDIIKAKDTKDNSQDIKIVKYTHPGGLQTSNGVLAVGMEKYFRLFGDAWTETNDAVICCYKTDKPEDYIKTKHVTDSASAAGIVFWKNKWIVAIRGNNKSVTFYHFDNPEEEKKEGALGSSIGEFQDVGEFQNLNLFLDENENIYMFGMTAANDCFLYRVLTSEDGNRITRLVAVWIDKNGLMKFDNHVHMVKNGINKVNKIHFACNNGASFDWSSCVHLKKNKNTGIGEDRKEDPNFIGNEFTGFLGKIEVYASSVNVKEVEKGKYIIPCNLFKEE